MIKTKGIIIDFSPYGMIHAHCLSYILLNPFPSLGWVSSSGEEAKTKTDQSCRIQPVF